MHDADAEKIQMRPVETRWGRVAMALPFVLLVISATRQVSSLDIGFHLRGGEYILDGNGWPGNDTFTYTCRERPYIDTSWGYQVMVASAQRMAGAAGIVGMHVALLVAAFGFVALTCRTAGADAWSTAAYLLAGAVACEMRYEARPELLSLCYMAALIYVCTRYAVGKRTPLWVLPVLFLLWGNSHSFFVVGWGILGLFFVTVLVGERRIDTRFLMWAGAAVLVCLVNPYGYRGVLFPLSLLTRFDQSNVFAQSIGELCSPFSLRVTPQMPFFPEAPIYTFRVLAALSVVSWVPLWRERRYRDIALSAVFLIISSKMLRNMPLFVVAMLPGLAAGIPIAAIVERLWVGRRAVPAVVMACMALVVGVRGLRTMHNATYIDDRLAQRFGTGWSRLEQPVDAAEFMKRVKLPGPMFNHLNYGGYLMWAQPEPVFIDGRLEVIGESFYLEYLKILNDAGEFAAATKKYGFRSVILPHAIAPTLLISLMNNTAWRLAYVDHLAAIFVKSDADAMRFVDPGLATILGERPEAPTFADLPGLGGRARRTGLANWFHGVTSRYEYPREEYQRALFHFIRGDMPAAERLFARVIDRTEGAHYEVYLNLGSVLWRQGRKDEARKCYRIVLDDDAGNALAQKRVNESGG
ncbi:MAG: tetratricopeptide repeat protein [Planctomycetes bacterium]|nr:tetratricopeptide repeat protein [Planctomycetota bacterium]